MPPLLSILMGVYYQKDSLAPLKRSVDSILSQTYTHFEFIICDEYSSQNAQEYLETMAKNDPRIRLLRPNKPSHLAAKLNACLEVAQGEFIARMDDDDFSYPTRLQEQMDYLLQHSHVAFVGSNVEYERGNEIIYSHFPTQPKVEDFRFSMPFVHPSIMFRRNAITHVNGYDEGKHCLFCEDYDLLLRLYQHGFVGENLSKPLLRYSLLGVEKRNKPMKYRMNELIIRYQRFKDLNMLPKALPYVVKPLIVGLLPKKLYLFLHKQKLK